MPAGLSQAPVPIAIWLTQDGDAHIQIADRNGAICGKIVWLKRPLDPSSGWPVTDKNNADAGKRGRPLMGVPVILAMQPDGANKWSGRIYNADDGKIYKGSVTALGPSMLKVEGCVLAFCDRETWTRVR